jgi:hypothetical protein
METKELSVADCSCKGIMIRDPSDISVRKVGQVVEEAMLSPQPILGIQSDKLL